MHLTYFFTEVGCFFSFSKSLSPGCPIKLTRNYFGEGDYLLLIVFKLKDANERETIGTYHVTTGIFCCVHFLHPASHVVQCVTSFIDIRAQCVLSSRPSEAF